jgi:purine-nucleoside phosphorylase
MLKKINDTVDFIKKATAIRPVAGIILGSGLGNLASRIDIEVAIPYADIPNFPSSTVTGHKGQLVFGYLSGKPIVAMQGRFHFYEGYTMQELSFPVRVMHALEIKLLILSNAAGGMNPEFVVGDIMFIRDHINLMPTNPLIGANEDSLGPRFPDMSEPYDLHYLNIADDVAVQLGIRVTNGVYAGVSGPCFETPAEYKYLRIIGADAVGMSTVPEVIVARHSGLSVFAVSVITDLGLTGHVEKISHEEVLRAANAAEPRLTAIVSGLLERI